MSNLQVAWKPHEGAQTFALQRREYEILYGGSRGGGKTDAGLAWLLYEKDEPDFRALVIRRNADDLSDWIDRARKLYTPLGATVNYRPAVITFPSGAVIKTGHLKDEGAYTKYQGHEYHKMLIEELTQIPTEKSYLKLISSCRTSNPKFKPQIFATTNPGEIGHAWVKRRFVDPAPPMTSFKDRTSGRTRIYVPATIADNPTLMRSDPDYVNFLESLKDTDYELWKAWRHGDWNTFAGQFFREFRADLHTCDPFEPKNEFVKYGGIDWGRVAPFVFLAAAFQRVQLQDGRSFHRVWVYREIDGVEKTPQEWAKAITKSVTLSEFREIRCDPSMFTKGNDGSISIADQFKQALPKHSALFKPSSNDRIGGWENIHKWLSVAPDGLPYLIISRMCHNLVRTMPELVHDDVKVEDVNTEGEDHHADALRYLLKHVKWIDARAGGFKDHGHTTPYPNLGKVYSGTLLLNADEFTKNSKTSRDWRAK